MKLKDRLRNKNLLNEVQEKQTSIDAELTDIDGTGLDELNDNVYGNFNTNDIFLDTKIVKSYINDFIQNNKNIILVCNKSFDKLIISNYIKSLLPPKKGINVIEELNSHIKDLNGKVNIFPTPDIAVIVKILEQIIYGCQSFIFSINLGNYDNVINKLKAIIALNYKNLDSNDIITLLGASNAVIVYILKNEDGLFYLSKIDEIKQNGMEIELRSILNENTNKNNDMESNSENSVMNSLEETLIIEKNKIKPSEKENSISIEQNNISDETKQVVKKEQEIINEEISEENQTKIEEKKLNKYELLREKVRQKKLLEKPTNKEEVNCPINPEL